MQPMARLSALPGHEVGERRPNLAKRPQDRLVDRLVDFGPEFRLPHEGGKHPQDVGVLRFLPWLPCHDARGHDARTSVWPKRPVWPRTFEPRTFRLSDSVGAGFAKSHPAAALPRDGCRPSPTSLTPISTAAPRFKRSHYGLGMDKPCATNRK